MEQAKEVLGEVMIGFKKLITQLLAFLFIILVPIAIIVYLFVVSPLYCAKLCRDPVLIFSIGFLASLTGSLLAEKQQDKLKNSAFGAIIGGSVGLFTALLSNDPNKSSYILYSLFGSSLGALAGWVIYAVLAFVAYLRYDKVSWLLQLITDGLDGVQRDVLEHINRDENKEVFNDVKILLAQVLQDLAKQVSLLHSVGFIRIRSRERDALIEVFLEQALASICQAHYIKLKQQKMRASIIKFDVRISATGKRAGRHFVYYDNPSRPYSVQKLFDKDSYIAFKVNYGQLPQVVSINLDDPIYSVEDRQSKDKYKSFTVFKLANNYVLTLDWPIDVRSTTAVNDLIDYIGEKITAQINDMLALWTGQ